MIGQKEQAPFAHYRERFRRRTLEEIERISGLTAENGVFSVPILDRIYPVSHPDYDPEPVTAVHTLLLRYLTEVGSSEETEHFLTFAEMPWGEVYRQPFQGRILTRAAVTFATRLQAFCDAAERLGGKKLNFGDAAYEFEFLKHYRLRWIFWQGDDEFPPSAQLLFSENFVRFSAEDRVVIAEIFINRLKEALV